MNQHYEFWVRYYKELLHNDKLLQSNSFNQKISGYTWKASSLSIPMQDNAVYMKTIYPGLLAGLGMPHNSGLAATQDKAAQAEIQMGFSLDPVTGLPVIPGTTIKGILRSAFIRNPAYVHMLIQEITGKEHSVMECKRLEMEIFGTRHPYDPAKPETNSDSRKGKDIFLDAFPVQPDKKNHLMGLDFITPHLADDEAYQGLTEPNPNAMLKVMPGVVFQFRFILHDSDLMDKEHKRTLFTRILEDFGAGAKTNTGYGRLETVEPEKTYYGYLNVDPASVQNIAQNNSGNRNSTDSRSRNQNNRRNNRSNTRSYHNAPKSFVESETGVVTRIASSRKTAFIKLDSGEEGRLYYTQIRFPHIKEDELKKYVSVGMKVTVWKAFIDKYDNLQLTMIDPNKRG